MKRRFGEFFAVLDELEEILSRYRYLTGGRITEADWRLFTTLVRFDPVYFGHFKCNLRRIADYPNLSNYLRDLYQVPGVAETVDIPHIKKHYYGSHENVNPTRIVPLGPEMDYSAPHNRIVSGRQPEPQLPVRRHRGAVEDLRQPAPCRRRGLLGQPVERKKRCLGDFSIAKARRRLPECRDQVESDVVAPARPPVEVD